MKDTKELVINLNKAKAKLNEAKESGVSSYIDEASRELDKAWEQLGY